MTILGMWSVAELSDLLKAKDYTIAQVEKGLVPFDPQWAQKDVGVMAVWHDDWNAFLDRYNAARSSAEMAIALATVQIGVPNSSIPADGEYNGVLRALKQVDGTVTKGDLQDLVERLQAAGATLDFSNTPQPMQGSDSDLNVYKSADRAAKEIDKTASTVFSPRNIALGVVGGLAALFVVVKAAK